MSAENTPSQFLKPLAAVSEKLVQDFARQCADPHRALVEQWEANMSRIARNFAEMVPRFRLEIPEGIRKLAERVQALEYLYDHGWIVSPFMYGKPISLELLSRGTANKRHAELNRVYERFFTEDNYAQLAAMISSWREHPIFKPRMVVFQSSIEILREFRRGRNRQGTNASAVLIPVLVAQLEGMLAFCAQRAGYVRSGTRVKVPGAKEKFGITQWIKDWSGPRDASNMPGAPSLFWMRFLDEMLFAGVYPVGQEEVRLKAREKARSIRPFLKFSRHKIAHGEDLRYGTIDNLLRAFLVLDFLAYVKWAGNSMTEGKKGTSPLP